MLCMSAVYAHAEQKGRFLFFGKKKAQTEQSDTAKVKKETEYDKLFKEKHEVYDGFVKLHKMKGKLYFELPVELLKKDMLLGSTVSEISDNGDAVVGSKPTDPIHIRFTKVGDKVNIVKMTQDYISESSNPAMDTAILKSSAGAIIESFKIDAYNNDSTAVVFDVTDFFVGDQKMMSPFDPYGVNTYMGQVERVEMFQSDKSFLGDVKAFESNISIKSHLSYTYSLMYGPQTLAEDVPFTAVMTRSLILLPEEPARPRIVDSRMAIFPTGKIMFSDKQQEAKVVWFANRWRLEPADLEAYKRGEKVEPKKPIVFYVDNAFPDNWKQAIFESVNQWNEPFEAIGFKNAIVAKEFPTDDPEFDPDNIKYSCIRYVPIGVQNAMGPSWVDPRTGEILCASVYVYHDVVKLLNNWRFIQTAQADPDVRGVNLPQDILSDGMRYVISHEVGHCLGFMHNMSASAVIPVDSLRSPSYTQKHGTTTSIMDYARFNYVAQPGDKERGVKLTPPRFGEYEYFTVKWAYTPIFDVDNPVDEYKITSKWISDAASDPVYRYGKQQFMMTLDPKSQMEDLGDDAVKASRYGIKNLKYIMANLNDWIGSEDRDFSHRTDLYTGIIYQYVTYIQHVFANVGGVYLQEKMSNDPVDAYKSVPAERQKEAFKFICDELKTLDWLDNQDLMKNIQIVGSARKTMENALIGAIVNGPGKVALSSALAEDGAYTPTECMKDLYDFVWEPTVKGRALTDVEMMLQREYMVVMCKGAGLNYTGQGAVPKQGLVAEHPKNPNAMYAIEMPEFVRDYAKMNRNLCYADMGCPMHTMQGAVDPAPVSGYDEPFVMFAVLQSHEADAYAYVLKVQQLLKNRMTSAPAATRNHYALILRNIEKTLK